MCVTLVSRDTMSRTGMPPLPAPTWKTCDTETPRLGYRRRNWRLSLRLGQRPFSGIVPDLVAREPAPARLHGKNAGVAGRVPAARMPGAPLPPHAQGLA